MEEEEEKDDDGSVSETKGQDAASVSITDSSPKRRESIVIGGKEDTAVDCLRGERPYWWVSVRATHNR